jgi:hypothetical protein
MPRQRRHYSYRTLWGTVWGAQVDYVNLAWENVDESIRILIRLDKIGLENTRKMRWTVTRCALLDMTRF